MAGGFRFRSIEDMPPSVRAAAEAALARQGGAKVLGIDTDKDGTSTAVSGVRLNDGTVVITGVDTMTPQVKSVTKKTPVGGANCGSAKRHKYAATATVVDGIRFDSKREAKLYESLKARQQAGEVAFFLRQVPIHLPGGTKLVVDFLVFFTDGRPPEFLDAKGIETAVFKVKRREVEAAYPIQIITV